MPKKTGHGHDPQEAGDRTPEAPDAARHLLSLLWEQAVDHAIILLNTASEIVGWRGAAADMFGYAEPEVLGKKLDFLFTAEDRARGLPAYERRVAAAVGRSEDDRWHVRKDGAPIWVFGSLVSLEEGGRRAGFAKVLSDGTSSRTLIETLQNRFDGAKRELEARDVFFGRLAHEVRNSLSPISNVASLLEKTDLNDRTRLPLAVIKRQVAQLERMMRDLAEVARFGAGKLQLSKTEFDLASDLVEIAEAVRGKAAGKRHELAVMVSPTPVRICADRQRVHQIIFNLLDNAIKYTPEGGHIWAQCTVEAGHGVVRIKDTGIGIAPELLPVIFDLFTQENPNQSEEGFGVGLSLVKDLVDAHHGFVEVSCEGKGRGSLFAVRLPLGGT